MGLRGHALVIGAVVTALVILVYCAQRSNHLPLHWTSSALQPRDKEDEDVGGKDCGVTACETEGRVGKETMAAAGKLPAASSSSSGGGSRQSVNRSHQKMSVENTSLYMPPSAPCEQPSVKLQSPADTLSHGRFVAESRNPCWWDSKGKGGNVTSQLRCLPYFFLVGVSKCGSTDIFSRLSGHPEVIPPGLKEPRWFDWKRYQSEDNTFTRYVSNFMQASWQISRDVGRYGSSEKVVGDGSPTYFWRNFHWGNYSGNEGCTEPRFVISDTIHRLLPLARIIISFRNPVTAIYSKYLSVEEKGVVYSPDHFHRLVVEEMQRFRLCLAHYSVRSCAYNVTLSKQAKVRLEKGLYAVYLSDWLRVFPRRQLHVLRFEDYIRDIAGHLQGMFHFLGLKAMPDRDLRALAGLPAFNQGHHYNVGQMLPATQRLLHEFYAPFNAQLAELMNDKRYLWVAD